MSGLFHKTNYPLPCGKGIFVFCPVKVKPLRGLGKNLHPSLRFG